MKINLYKINFKEEISFVLDVLLTEEEKEKLTPENFFLKRRINIIRKKGEFKADFETSPFAMMLMDMELSLNNEILEIKLDDPLLAFDRLTLENIEDIKLCLEKKAKALLITKENRTLIKEILKELDKRMVAVC